jgi:hypothetical protein
MPSVKLTIYSTDNQKIKSMMSFYVGANCRSSSVAPTNQNIDVYVPEFISTSQANNNCLISIEQNRKGEIYGIIRSRIGFNNIGPAETNGGSVSESYDSTTETPINAIVRGLKEELGTVIDPSYFFTNGSSYAIVIDASAKNRIINNYQRLLPLTELYDVAWVPLTPGETVPQASKIVPDTAIYEYQLIQKIDTALGGQLPQNLGVLITSPSTSYAQASHGISNRPIPVAPRQLQAAPAPVQSSSSSSNVASTYPSPNPGEKLSDYVTRISTGPPKLPNLERIKIRAYGLSLGLTGGRTYRRKNRHSKKKRLTHKN